MAQVAFLPASKPNLRARNLILQITGSFITGSLVGNEGIYFIGFSSNDQEPGMYIELPRLTMILHISIYLYPLDCLCFPGAIYGFWFNRLAKKAGWFRAFRLQEQGLLGDLR